MGVYKGRSTLWGCVTPICNDCGVVLCYDISKEDYEEQPLFWDKWKCETCDPHYVMNWQSAERIRRRSEE